MQQNSDVNPLKSDFELQTLLKKLDKVKKYKTFQRWKSKFLDRLEQFLYEKGMDPAEKTCNAFALVLTKFVKNANAVAAHIEKGDLGNGKKTVKASLALNEMCNSLTNVVSEVETLIPSRKQEEKKKGFNKFHLGAALIRQGFHQYAKMKAIEDAVDELGGKLTDVADRQQHELFEMYKTQVQRFCDVMADLNLYEVMLKCIEFAEEPEEEESSDEEDIALEIEVDTPEGKKTLKLEVDPNEKIGTIKEVIADSCGIVPEKQVLKFKGKELKDNKATLKSEGIENRAKLTVEPFKVPVTVKTYDGKTIELMIDPVIYMSDLKRMIADEAGIPAKKQSLSMNGEELDNDFLKAEDYGVKAGSELYMEPKSIGITATMPDGSSHTFDVSMSDTPESIKDMIANETGMPVASQVLSMNGKDLADGKTLRDLGVRDGSNVDVSVLKIPVVVETYDGQRVEVSVDPMSYLSDLKRQVEPETGVPAINQKLFMDNKELNDDNVKAKDYGIVAGSLLYMEPKSMKINVELPDNTVISVDVSPSETIASVKEKIADGSDMASIRQVLKYNGKELPNSTTVKKTGLKDGSTVKVEVFKVPVTVNTHDGKKLQVLADPTQSLGEFKKQLEHESGLSPTNQKLSLEGNALSDDGKALSDYGVKAGSELDLEPLSVSINVEMPDGTKHIVEISPSETIDSVKDKIADCSGMAKIRQVLKHDDKELPNKSIVKKTSLEDGSTVKVEVFKVPVTVNTHDGKKLQVMADPTQQLGDFKKQLESESGLSPTNQNLYLDGNALSDDGKALSDYGVKAGSELDLEPLSVSINVEMPDGSKHTIEISPCETIDSVKDKIADCSGMAKVRQVLKHDGKELPNKAIVKKTDLKDGSTVKVEVFKVPVTVNTHDGEKLQVMADPTQTLGDFKKELENDSGLSPTNQKLSLAGKELGNDGKSLGDYGVEAGSELDLEPIAVSINVEMPDGRKHTIEISPCETIDSVKDKIADCSGMAKVRQVLKHDGKELPNKAIVKKTDLKDGSTVKVEVFKVPVTVNTHDGEKLQVMADPTQTLGDFKKELENDSGLSPTNQKLSLAGKELGNDGKSLGDYGVEAGSELDLEPIAVNINVEMPDGRKHTVEISPSESIASVKDKIADCSGMASIRQVLKYNGEELPNSATVKKTGLEDGSTVKVEIFKVPVTVNTHDGRKLQVMVDPTQKLSAFKKQLENDSGLAPANQKLTLEGNPLSDDDKTLSDYGVKAGSEFDLEPMSVTINVEMPDGAKHSVAISPLDRDADIKAKIEQKTGMTVPRQVLKMNGKILPSRMSALDMGIEDGSNINVELFTVPVVVRSMDGTKAKVNVDPTAKLSSIKSQLEPEFDIKASNQKLFLQGHELTDNNKSAKDHGIVSGSELYLEPKVINVDVAMPDGQTHTIGISPSDTSAEIKAAIAAKTGVETPRQVLNFNEKDLPELRPARDLGVKEGSSFSVNLFTIPVSVKTPDGQTHSFQVEPCSKVDSLKKQIEKDTGIAVKKQRLIFGEDELTDGKRSMDACGVKARSLLTLELITDHIIFVDVKCGTLFAMERDQVIAKGALSPHQNNKLDFVEGANDSAAKEKLVAVMMASPKLGLATQVVVEKNEVEDYDLEEAEKVKSMWGVNLKKREKNKKGEELIFVDPKTGACGELSRKKYIDMNFITPVDGKEDTIAEAEKDTMTYEKYIAEMRTVFGIRSAQ